MNAVERITEYRSLPTEAAEVIDDKRPPPEWPAQGSVEIKDLQVRYRAELDLVLKGISGEGGSVVWVWVWVWVWVRVQLWVCCWA